MKKKKMTPSIEALIEHFDAKFNLLIDGYAALEKKIDANHQEFKEFVAEINDKFEVVFEELADIRKQLKSVKI